MIDTADISTIFITLQTMWDFALILVVSLAMTSIISYAFQQTQPTTTEQNKENQND
jgi:hypothetical protein